MRRIQLLCTVAVILSSAMAGGQTTPAGPLSSALRTHLAEERLDLVTSVRGLPIGVRNALQDLFGTHSIEIARDIADPGGQFQVTDVIVTPRLPLRRLAAAGCSIDHCLVYYERGGIAHSWQVALFHWIPAETRLEWGAPAPGGLATFDDVLKAVLSGALKGPNRVW